MTKKQQDWVDAWEARINAIAVAAGKTAEAVNAALKSIIGGPSENGLKMLEDEALTPFGDLRKVLCDDGLGIPVAILRQYMPIMRGKAPQLPAVAGGTAVAVVGISDILPEIKDEDALTRAIKTGGELKTKEPLAVLFANRAGVANRYGLFEMPNRLAKLMEKHADELDEPCGKEFYALLRLVRRKRYADILEDLGVEAAFVTNARKDDLLNRVQSVLWPSLYKFQLALLSWKKAWLADMGENQMLAFAVAMSQRSDGASLPEGMVTPPETGVLYDEAEGVNNGINAVLSGTRLPIAVALATEAKKVKELLEDDKLPISIGATNKDEMLKMIGISASASDIRLEQNLARYTLGILSLPDWRGQKDEYRFLAALLQLGQQIKWDELLGKTPVARPTDPARPTGRRSIGSVTVIHPEEDDQT